MNPRSRLLSVALGVPLLLGAQNYSLERGRFTGGGGLSTGAGYAVRGLAGQAEAGAVLAGGGYTLTGGFRGELGVVQTPGAPALAIRQSTDGTVVVSWPASPRGWSLQQSDRLTSDSWTAASHAVTEAGTNRFINLTPQAGRLFFRLHKPD